MSYWILTPSAHVISCVTVQNLTRAEQSTDLWKERMRNFDEGIKKALIAKNITINSNSVPAWNRLTLSDMDEEFQHEFRTVVNDTLIPEADNIPEFTEDTYDPYLGMELGLPCGADDDLHFATVKKRKYDHEGNPIGVANKNPILDTRTYEVLFADGSYETMNANMIAENIIAQVDEEGHRQLLFDEIIDHRRLSTALDNNNASYKTRSGTTRMKKTTVGWEYYVQWKDGSQTWVCLKDLKHSYPIELAEYAVSHQLDNEPAFRWWVTYTLRKRKAIIQKLKSKYWDRTHKYGIHIPKTVEEAEEIDTENGNRLWFNAIEEEMVKI